MHDGGQLHKVPDTMLHPAAPPLQAAIPNGGATDGPEPAASGDDLLGEFIPLGEAAAAVAKPAAATDAGQRPELLKRVPWLKALKGIRSPLLRLHQGGAGRSGARRSARMRAAAKPRGQPGM